MKKLLLITLATCALLSSCEEFQPVYTFNYKDSTPYEGVELEPTHTIAQLTALYTPGKPVLIEDDIVIAGRVVSSDKTGNFYKQIFIQDQTGGIEVKIGKYSLHNEYKPGQMVYVKCGPGDRTGGLTLASYGYKSGNYGGNGMPQLGAAFYPGEYATTYESSYLQSDRVINDHVFRGPVSDIEEQVPVVLSESQLPSSTATHKDCPYIGRLVTLKNLSYGGECFALLYLSSESSSKESKNRVFLSDQTWGIDTWAMSKTNFLKRLQRGDFDSATVGNSGDDFGAVGNANLEHVEATDPVFMDGLEDETFRRRVYYWVYGVTPDNDPDFTEERLSKENLQKYWVRYCLATNANGYSVSQYFKMGGTDIQLRTSGFAKFADDVIPAEVINGSKKVSITGVLTLYQGSIQLVVNDVTDIVVE